MKTEKKHHWYKDANDFVRTHLLLILIILAGVYWIGGDDVPVLRQLKQSVRNTMAYDVMEEASMDGAYAPSMAKSFVAGRGGGSIMVDNFDPTVEDRKITKNGNLTIEVINTETSREQAETLIKDMGGYVTNLNSWEVRPRILAYNMTVRIPVEKLEESIEKLVALGVKKSESFSVNDITAQYVDNEARLKNLRARRERLLELMERESKRLEDVLEIDRELNNVQVQIEQLERQQKRNDADVAYSTLNLSIQPEPEIGDISNPEWNPGRSWTLSVNKLIRSFQGVVDKLIAIVVYIPLWLPIVLILWALHRWLKRHV